MSPQRPEQSPWADATTLRQAADAGGPREARVPALTVLSHPDIGRVGDCARLPGLLTHRPTELSRAAPTFATPAGQPTGPLMDRYVSRRPVRLVPSDGSILLIVDPGGMRLVADGAPVLDRVEIARTRLSRGVVLELADRVALLLHEVPPPAPLGDAMELVGADGSLGQVRASIRTCADLDHPVLILGESGTGKELVARAIHARSTRADRALVSVNMATVMPSTAASALFGHVRGAFTGADREHVGLFAEAHRGTLFLDEVGATPVEVQDMLLRVLETGELRPVGSRDTRRVDVRVIAATDADLTAEGFRSALLHRLAATLIRIPPLRERRADIARLLVHFLQQEVHALGQSALLSPDDGLWLPPAVVARLCGHGWPGNVRELRNAVRQLVVSSRGRPRLDPGVLEMLLPAPAASTPEAAGSVPAAAPVAPVGRRPSEIDDDTLIRELSDHGWRIAPTARALGISRTSLYELIDHCARIRKAGDIGADELGPLIAAGERVEEMASRLQVSVRGLKLRLTELGLTGEA